MQNARSRPPSVPFRLPLLGRDGCYCCLSSLYISTTSAVSTVATATPPSPSPPPPARTPPPHTPSPSGSGGDISLYPRRNSLHQPGATCRSMASCRWLVEPGTTPRSLLRLSLSRPPPIHPLSPSFSFSLFRLLLVLLPLLPYTYSTPPPRTFSLSFLPRTKARRVPSRRVDPIREGELFL